MENRLIALKLLLDGLGVQPEIETLDDRKKVQKAVYLGQITGVELGYRFGWYLLGPYSKDLARDYYALAAALESGDVVPSGVALHPAIRDRLKAVQPLINAPAGVDLPQEDWLELLASLHYLRSVSRCSFDASVSVMNNTAKRRLVPFATQAEERLRAAHLLE